MGSPGDHRMGTADVGTAAPVVPPLRRVRFRATGTVQGVGFRPTVRRWAHDLGLDGWVGNEGADLVGEVQGPRAAVDELVDRIADDPPPLAAVARLEVDDLAPTTTGGGFAIARSAGGRPGGAIPADRAPCAACRGDIDDPASPFHRHPFTSCTACGPRLTIVTSLPYDRERTTMAAFPLCPACRAGYEDPEDRRFHAEATCCPACGPTLRCDAASEAPGAQLDRAAVALQAGEVLVVKGVGGHHLCCRADDDPAVARIRAVKAREHKPLAVLVADLDAARRLCHLDDGEAQLLSGDRAPIVLCRRRADAPVADGVAPGTDRLGLLLPPSPLHLLLARATAVPLVLTSANPSDEPMLIDDGEVARRIAPAVDGVVGHDRRIASRIDDSVARVVAGVPRLVRRARGWAPEPIPLSVPVDRPVLAVGADLKSAACLAVGDRAWLTTHLGDLAHPDARDAHRAAIQQVVDMVGVHPEVVAHDLHPGYASTQVARALADEWDVPLVAVQHHHAHAVACLAEHGHQGPALALALDGLGYGPDGTVWGGELLAVAPDGWRRVDHLRPVALPGGSAAIRAGWRMAVAHLHAAGIDPVGLEVHRRHRAEWDAVARQAAAGINAPLTSSAGRLFDAVAALCDVRDENRYEGDAATALEQVADRSRPPGPGLGGTSAAVVRRVVERLRDGTDPGEVAAAFHDDVVALIAEAAVRAAASTGIGVVALSGGVFQNARLLEHLEDRLRSEGLRPLSHRAVPTNDGGVSLGQAAVAGGIHRPSAWTA